MKKIIFLAISSLFLNISWAENTPVPVTPAASAEAVTTDASENDVTLDHGMKVVSKSSKTENAKLHYTIDVKYPVIEGKALTVGAKNFNKTILKMVQMSVQQFKNNVGIDMVHQQSLPADLQKNTYKLDYDIDVIKPNKDDIISVRLSVEAMQGGHAHPYHEKHVVNFDLNKGQAMTLTELFKPNSRYLQAISAYSNKMLSEKLKHDNWMVAQGTKPDVKNFKNWNLQDDSILITFDEYQVAPYAYGPQEVEIPYSALKTILSKKAPIATCAVDEKNCAVG